MDFRDLMYKWIYIPDANNYDFFSKELKDENNSLIGFLYIDHTAGISCRILYSAYTKKLKLTKSAKKSLNPVSSMMIVRYPFDNFYYEFIDNKILKKLEIAPVPSWLSIYLNNDEHNKMRQYGFLDEFRAEGYPDDVKVFLPGINGLETEQVWVRLESADEKSFIISGTLLNQPNQDFGINENDTIELVLYQKGDEKHLLWNKF